MCSRYRQITSHSFVTQKILFLLPCCRILRLLAFFKTLQSARLREKENEKFIQITSDYDGKSGAKWHRNEIEKDVDGVIKLRKIRFQYHYWRSLDSV